MRARGPAIVFLLVVVLGGLIVGVPWATTKRPQVVSVPIARPTATEAPVLVGQRPVCVVGVELGPDADAIAVQAIGTEPGPPLAVEVRGPGGYAANATVAGGYLPGTGLSIAFRPATRELAGGSVCLRSAEPGLVARLLGGTSDRQLGIARTTVVGQPAPVQLALALQELPAKGLTGRIGQLADRAGELRPFPFAGWVLVLLGLLALVSAPLLVAAAIAAQRRRA